MASNGDSIVLAFLAIPASVFGSMIGFLALNQMMALLQNTASFFKSSDIELLRKTIYPPFKVLTSQVTATFGTKFTPNPTHVLLGALIIVIVVMRRA